MLTRLYANNYRCLLDFEYRPAPSQLLLGANGAGKSSVFQLIAVLQAFLRPSGPGCGLFTARGRTLWLDEQLQTFEVEVALGQVVCRYRLVVELDPRRDARVLEETLADDAGPLFSFSQRQVQLYDDDHAPGPAYPFESTRSALALVPEEAANTKLCRFRSFLQRAVVLRPDPFGMTAESKREDAGILVSGANFASWYRGLVLERPLVTELVSRSMREFWDGFEHLSLIESGEQRLLMAAVAALPGTGAQLLELTELSEGQRCLLLLYSVLHWAASSPEPVLICLDEPDNFVALAELQPLLGLAEDVVQAGQAQILVASHHPALLDSWGRDGAVVLSRERGGPTRLQAFEPTAHGDLPPSEIVARGWEHE